MFGVREAALNNAAKTAVGFVLGWLALRFGFDFGPEAEAGLITFVVAVLGVLATLVQGFLTRAVVTPLADPRNAAGTPLTPDAPGNVVGLD